MVIPDILSRRRNNELERNLKITVLILRTFLSDARYRAFIKGSPSHQHQPLSHYRGADKSLARPTSPCILFDGENISFDVSLYIYIYSTNIPPIMIINRIYQNQNLLSL